MFCLVCAGGSVAGDSFVSYLFGVYIIRMVAVIKFIIRVLTTVQVYLLLTIVFGKQVGFSGLRMQYLFLITLPVLFIMLSILQTSINKGELSVNFIPSVFYFLIIANAVFI